MPATTSIASHRLTRWAAGLLIALVAVEVLLPTGCIGIQVAVGSKEVRPVREARITAQRPRAGGDVLNQPEDNGVPHIKRPTPTSIGVIGTAMEAQEAWGMPDERRTVNGRDVWTYRGRLKWRGLLVWAVLVPIPLQVPVGRYKVELAFEGDSLRSVTLPCRGEKLYGLFLMQGASFGQAYWHCR